MELKWIPELHGIFEGLISSFLLLLFGFVYGPFRTLFFYTTYQYVLKYSGDGKRVWDIKTHLLLLTVEVNEVHDNYIKDMYVTVNAAQNPEYLGNLDVDDRRLSRLKKFDMEIGVAQIVRTFDPSTSKKEYEIHLVVRKRRFFITR